MEIFAHIIGYAIIGFFILGGLGLVVLVCQFFYYRQWKSGSVKVYYDDNDRRKGYYIVKRPRGPYPVGYPREQILKDIEAFERLKREQKEKSRGRVAAKWDYPFEIPDDPVKYEFAERPAKQCPMWVQILFMTPAEYMEYRRRKKAKREEAKKNMTARNNREATDGAFRRAVFPMMFPAFGSRVVSTMLLPVEVQWSWTVDLTSMP